MLRWDSLEDAHGSCPHSRRTDDIVGSGGLVNVINYLATGPPVCYKLRPIIIPVRAVVKISLPYQ